MEDEKRKGGVERLSHSRKTWRGGFATNGPVCEQLKTQKPHVCLGACIRHSFPRYELGNRWEVRVLCREDNLRTAEGCFGSCAEFAIKVQFVW